MTKRRAESASLQEVPQEKKCRCARAAEPELEAVHALHAAAPPPPHALFTTLIGERRRKRPRNCEDREQHGRAAEPERRLNSATGGENKEAEDARGSGKFRRASGACTCRTSSEEGASGACTACTCEMESKGRASAPKSEESTKVTRPDDNEDELCAFNSFQFWRTPLPELDLSLLDSQPTTHLNKDSSVKDAMEEMET